MNGAIVASDPLFERARVEQLGDAEIEQLDLALGVDQRVGRFQVAMDDEVAMRVGHRVADLREQFETLVQRSVARVAVVEQRNAVDVLHHRVRTAIRRHAAVEQARDAGMIQPRENLPLGVEARLLADRLEAQQLERAALAEPGFVAQRRVDLAHATAPDQPLDAPGAEACVRSERRRDRRGVSGIRDRRRVEHALRRVGAQQFRDFAMQLRVVAAGARQPFAAPPPAAPTLAQTIVRAAPSVRVARRLLYFQRLTIVRVFARTCK